MRGRISSTALVDESGAIASFSDHWAGCLRDDACALLTVELRNDLAKALEYDRELAFDELRRQPQCGEAETS